MTPTQAANALQRMAARLERNTLDACRATGEAILRRARELSSGPYTTAQLRQMYNPYGPYSRRDPHPPADPAIINRQSGRFLAAWEITEPAVFAAGIRGAVESDARTRRGFPYARALATGTRLMIARPLPERVADAEEEAFRDRVERAVDKTFR